MTADRMTCYINGIGILAPQETSDEGVLLEDIKTYDNNRLTCITPDFKDYINPVQLRRLSRMLRIGMTSAIICLRNANLRTPDGIITATGYGFLGETEKFLSEVLERVEKQITPTHFVQGTYNALAGLIGLTTKCTGYNNTYVSKGFAFENALQDALLQLESNHNANFLVGGFDEAEDVLHAIGTKEQFFKTEKIQNTQLFNSRTQGTIQGEGSAFFTLSGRASEKAWCILGDVKLIYRPATEEDLASALENFLEANKISLDKIDGVLSGASGDVERDWLIERLEASKFSSVPLFRFKHLCGEYCTAVSFATCLGASILKKQFIPKVIRHNTIVPQSNGIKTLLIVNHYLNRNYSLILLTRHP